MKGLTLFVVLVACLSIAIPSNAAEPNLSADGIDITDCEILSGFYQLWKISFFGREPNRIEAGAWIVFDPNGEYQFLQWEITPERQKVSWNRPVPLNKIAQAHTHPQAVDPKPSSHDREIAVQLGIPIYTISRNGIWKAMPDGTIRQESGKEWHIKARSNRCI